MKISITENQLKTVKKLLNEQSNTENFKQNVEIHFTIHNSTINGHEINYINEVNSFIEYGLNLEKTSWGYNGITLTSLKGESSAEIEVEYYENDDETNTQRINLDLDWSNIEFEEVSNVTKGMIGINNQVEIILGNNENGDLIVKKILIGAFGFTY